MWLALFIAAEVTLIVWLAAIVLAVRDRRRGTAPPMAPAQAESKGPAGAKWAELSMPRKAFLLLIGVYVLPVSVLVLTILAVPLLAYNAALNASYWLRLKLFGIPIPVYTVPGTAEDNAQSA
jgi:hypothetical protein